MTPELDLFNHRLKVMEDKIKTLDYGEKKMREKIEEVEKSILAIIHTLQDLKTYLSTLK